jgi:signal transduction histidine kinase
VADIIRSRWANAERFRGLGLSIAALFVILATSSELWPTNDDSFFSLIPTNEIGIAIVFLLFLLLFFLYILDLHRFCVSTRKTLIIVLSFLFSLADVGIFYTIGSFLYGSLFVQGVERFFTMWEILFIGLPLLIGEFTLSSRASKRLEEAKELYKKTQRLLEKAQEDDREIEERKKKKGPRPKLPE